MSRPAPLVVALSLLLVLGGCTGGSGTPGGTLRLAAGEPDSLDPARSYQPWVWNLMRLYVRTLVTYSAQPGADGANLVPDLATDLGSSPDGGRTWTYTLREGLRFADGSPITAQAVKYGIERSFAAEVITGGPTYVVDLLDDPANVYGGPYLDPTPDRLGLRSVETPDERTIVFRLNRPYVDFGHVLALPSSAPVPAAADTGADYGAAPVSSGPYSLTAVDPELGLTFERNPQWDPATDQVRTALPERVEVRTGLPAAERDRLLLAGAVDADLMPSGLSDPARAEVAADPALAARSDNHPRRDVLMLALPTGVAPMQDVNCRRAIALALDPGRLADSLGQVPPAQPAGNLWPRALPGYAEVDAGQDPGAQTEAQAACPATDLAVRLAVPDEPEAVRLADAVARQLAQVSIDVEVVPAEVEGYYGTGIGEPAGVAEDGLNALMLAWSPDLPTPGTYFPPLVAAVSSTGNANYAEVGDPAAGTLVDRATAAAPAEAALTQWRQLENLLREQAYYVPLVQAQVVTLGSPRLHNAAVHPAYGGYDVAVLGVG